MAWERTKAARARLALVDRAAAEMGFYLALSMVPLVGVAIALVSRWRPIDLSVSIEEVLRDVLPVEAHVGADQVLRWARSNASQGWVTTGFAVALWTSFRFMSLCIRLLGAIVGVFDEPPVRAWRLMVRSLLLLVVWIVALVVTALSLLVMPAIERGWLHLRKLSDLSDLSLSAIAVLQAFLVGGILFGAIFLTYRVVVGTRTDWRRLVLAALLASLGWIVASRGFSLVVPVLWKTTLLFGTLGSMTLFLIWAYVIASILLLGGFLLVRSDETRTAS